MEKLSVTQRNHTFYSLTTFINQTYHVNYYFDNKWNN